MIIISAPIATGNSNRSSIAKVIAIIAIYTVHSAMRSNLKKFGAHITVSGFVSALIICEWCNSFFQSIQSDYWWFSL